MVQAAPEPPPRGVALAVRAVGAHARLRCDVDLRTGHDFSDELADRGLGRALPEHVGGVDESAAGLDERLELRGVVLQADLVGGPGHRAQAEGGDLDAAASKWSAFHDLTRYIKQL